MQPASPSPAPHFAATPMLAPPRLVVYDLDGTLVDAFEDIWRGIITSFRQAGLPELPFEQVKSYVGDGARVLMERCLGAVGAPERFDEIFPVFGRFYVENPEPKARPYPEVIETLRALRGRGIRQAVLSNKPHPVTLLTLQRLGLAPLLDAMVGEDPRRPRKPDPASLRAVLEPFGVAEAEAWMVGDGPADYAVATAAGVPFVGVSYGLLTREQMTRLGAAVVVDRFAELDTLAGAGASA